MRLIVADDSFIVREALVALLGDLPSVEVQAACGDLDTLLVAVDRLRPDVVLTDIRMPPGFSDEGIRAAARLRASHPDVGVVILSQYVESAYVLELFRDGSEGRAYLVKDRVHDRVAILEAVRAVARGEAVIDPKVVELLVAARSRADSPLAELSPRESEILAGIATGKTNGAIARDLHLSKRSVEKHVHAIFSKLGLGDAEDVSPRVKAALIFLAEDPPPVLRRHRLR
jgi:DNA-binding NarL/FixJ family response regulator